jgi:apolipoprotein N-acyltransferase
MEDFIFLVSNLIVLPFWLLMIALPFWAWTKRIMRSPLILLPLPVLYAGLVVPRLGYFLPAVMNPTLPAIAEVLGKPEVAAVAWIHLLAFDFFVGRWVYLDSREKGRNPWLMALVLFFILMLGPFGLLLYLALDAFSPRPAATSNPEKTSA